MSKNYILDWPKIWKDLNDLFNSFTQKSYIHGTWATNIKFVKFLVNQQLADKKISKKRLTEFTWARISSCFNQWFKKQGKPIHNPSYHWTRQKQMIRQLVELKLIERGIKPPKEVLTPIKRVLKREESIIIED